jgi:hypothetical protein
MMILTKKKTTNQKNEKYRDFDQNMEDDNSLSTTDSHHLELLKNDQKEEISQTKQTSAVEQFCKTHSGGSLIQPIFNNRS